MGSSVWGLVAYHALATIGQVHRVYTAEQSLAFQRSVCFPSPAQSGIAHYFFLLLVTIQKFFKSSLSPVQSSAQAALYGRSGCYLQ